MTGPLEFWRSNGKKVSIEIDEKIGMKLSNDDKKKLKPLFDAIAGDDKIVDNREYALALKLQTIFANTGDNEDGRFIDSQDIALVKEWETAKASGKSIEAWINEKVESLTKPAAIDKDDSGKVENQGDTGKKVDTDEKSETGDTQEVEKKAPTVTVKKGDPRIAQARQFNQTIQNLTKKFEKAEYENTFTL